jgi:hypothetical protein
MSRAGLASLLGAAVLVAGCGGSGDEDFDGTSTSEDSGDADTGDTTDDVTEASTMPDVIGLPVDEAVAELEAAGFQVNTGVVRTTEMEPDLVYRSEPAPGRQIREGQRVTLRIAAEPRE